MILAILASVLSKPYIVSQTSRKIPASTNTKTCGVAMKPGKKGVGRQVRLVHIPDWHLSQGGAAPS